MAPPKRSPFDICQLLGRFSGDAALISRLLVQNDAFRNMCEDLVLAKSALTQLETVQREQEATKIAEYRQLIAELESEITEALEHASQSK